MKKSTKLFLGAAGALTALNCVKAARFKPEKSEAPEPPQENVNEERAAEHLSAAIRIKTISNADKALVDWSEFEKFRAFLDEAYPLIKEKLEKEIVEEANIIYRWKGKNPSLEPIALLSHQDVVPVTPGTEDDWEHPAFEGYNDGEYIWGRGSLDMKNHLISVMEAVETLLEEGFEPERDVYLLFGQNEEVVASGESGATAIAELLKERGVHLDSVIDEGGAMLPVNIKGVINKNLAGIGIAEKGYADIEISLNDKGGHSSQAPKHTAVGKMAKVIKDIEAHQFKAEMMPFLSSLFTEIGKNVSYPARLVTCNIPLLKPALTHGLTLIPSSASMLRTTTAITMINASKSPNVLPQRVSVTANFRMMPGVTTDDVVDHIKKVVRNKNIEVRVIRSKEASNFSPTDSRAFNAIKELCLAFNPDSVVAPYLVMGGTDACFYEPVCDNIYRFAPFIVSTGLLLCTHGTNERIPVAELGRGVKFFKAYIRKLSKD